MIIVSSDKITVLDVSDVIGEAIRRANFYTFYHVFIFFYLQLFNREIIGILPCRPICAALGMFCRPKLVLGTRRKVKNKRTFILFEKPFNCKHFIYIEHNVILERKSFHRSIFLFIKKVEKWKFALSRRNHYGESVRAML